MRAKNKIMREREREREREKKREEKLFIFNLITVSKVGYLSRG